MQASIARCWDLRQAVAAGDALADTQMVLTHCSTANAQDSAVASVACLLVVWHKQRNILSCSRPM